MVKRQEEILEKIRKIPSQKIDEIIDFIDFLEQREKKKAWIEFDEWAMNLAKEKGFNRLTEDDIAQIVKQHRLGV